MGWVDEVEHSIASKMLLLLYDCQHGTLPTMSSFRYLPLRDEIAHARDLSRFAFARTPLNCIYAISPLLCNPIRYQCFVAHTRAKRYQLRKNKRRYSRGCLRWNRAWWNA